MTRPILAAALASAILAAVAAPAFAVSIKHTDRAEGDPEAAAAPRTGSHAAPPADMSGPRYFDKFHQDGDRG